MIFLVRHAKAGHRDDRNPRDDTRPLSANGQAQAVALAPRLLDAGATGPALASPYTRCMQTLAPFAERAGIEVTPDDRLIEGSPIGPLVELITTAAPGTVLCSHGDVIPDVIAGLQRRGCEITTPPDWRKGSTWVLTVEDGRVTKAASWPPPEV
jgi:8-oxo-dGTP diphosphatase